MKNEALIVLAASCLSCAFLQKHEDDLAKLSTAILCVVQQEEIGDEALGSMCDKILGTLTAEQRAAVTSHASAARQARAVRRTTEKTCVPIGKDGGS